MTKEDFKKKYHGKSVKIEPSMQVQRFGEIAERPRRIQEMCKLMGLEAHQVTVPAPYLLITIVDKQQEYRTNAEPLTPIDEEEFLADFKIEYGEISKSPTTSKDVMSTGFIQAYTSNEASLWWHPNGKRIFFVRGEGAFSITDKVEENA